MEWGPLKAVQRVSVVTASVGGSEKIENRFVRERTKQIVRQITIYGLNIQFVYVIIIAVNKLRNEVFI